MNGVAVMFFCTLPHSCQGGEKQKRFIVFEWLSQEWVSQEVAFKVMNWWTEESLSLLLLLMCRGLTRSSRKHTFAANSLSPSFSECWHTHTHASTCTHTLIVATAVQRVRRCCLLGSSEWNDYHTSVSTCHWALPCPSPMLKRWHLLTAALVALC